MVVFFLVLIWNLAEHAWHITDTSDFTYDIQNLNTIRTLVIYHCHFRMYLDPLLQQLWGERDVVK